MGTPDDAAPKYAFLGVRACELAAIRVQDRTFLEGPYVDPIYPPATQTGIAHRRQLHAGRLDLLLHFDGNRPALHVRFRPGA